MPETLNRLLLESCLDTAVLDRLRADLEGELTAAGVSPKLRSLVEDGRGALISRAVLCGRALPSAEAISAAVRERAEGDPVFVDQLRTAPRLTIERLLGLALPGDATVVVTDGDPVDVVVDALSSPIDLDAFEGAYMTETQVVEVVDVVEVVEVVDVVEALHAQSRLYWNGRRELWRTEHEARLAKVAS